jgi:hypothetical protein
MLEYYGEKLYQWSANWQSSLNEQKRLLDMKNPQISSHEIWSFCPKHRERKFTAIS